MDIDFKSIVDSLTVPTFVIDSDHTVLAWNRACEVLTGLNAEDVIGTKESWRGFYPNERPCLADIVVDNSVEQLDALYSSSGLAKFSQGLHAENWFPNINGEKRYLIFEAAPIYDEHGRIVACIENLEDVTEMKVVEDRLMLSDKVFSYTNQSILITDATQRIVQVNDAFVALTGYTLDEIRGKTPSILKSDRHDSEFYKKMHEELNDSGHWEGEVWDKKKDGSVYPKWLSINKVFDQEKKRVSHYIAIFSDITERKNNEEHVRHIAFHDALTGLPNRLLFHDRLEQAITNAKRKKCKIALMFIDLDRFKIVNDTLGHHVGDLLLQEVAKRLKQCVREADTVARLGGDEFVVIVDSINRVIDVSMIAQNILESLNKVITIGTNDLYTSPSIGISLYPNDAQTVEGMMQAADTAMYHVKEADKNNYQFFTQIMTDEAKERARLEKDLRKAINKQQFELHYQPKIDLYSNRVTGCEALLRWKHPEQGYIPPDVFISLAEECGLISQLGDWVLHEAANEVSKWHEQGIKELTIAINLSPLQFRDVELEAKINDFLIRSKIAPNQLECEITENILIDKIAESEQGLRMLKSLGLALAIDDFGTGYSSLAYLKLFDIDTLKIDKSFVQGIEANIDNLEIVTAVVSLAHNLGLKVVAEGIETKEQLELISQIGCDLGQGYYFSKAVPSDDFIDFVHKT